MPSLFPNATEYDVMPSPVGLLSIFVSSWGVHGILWADVAVTNECKRALLRCSKNPNNIIIAEVKKQLTAYFSGRRQIFDLPFCLEGTPFQVKAWEELYKIPYAQTMSYGEQAARLGDKNKARAVGHANALNPISIVIPCHRVINKSGKLGGYAGGTSRKEWLLAHEKQYFISEKERAH